jgi:hypothetical protein
MWQSLTWTKTWFKMSMAGTVDIEGAIAIAVPATMMTTVIMVAMAMADIPMADMALAFRSSAAPTLMMAIMIMAGEGTGITESGGTTVGAITSGDATVGVITSGNAVGTATS